MTKMNAWHRLLLVLSVFWFIGISGFVGYEYISVNSGGQPKQFVVLKDIYTGTTFGKLSYQELKELAELTLRKSKSDQAEHGDAEEAQRLLKAKPKPSFR